MTAWLQVLAVVLVLAAAHVPLGDHLARTFTVRPASGRPGHLRVERAVYRLVGVDPDGEQDWRHYLGSLLAFSLVSVLGLYLLLRVQPHLPLSLGRAAMSPAQSFDTAVSFATNTSWQSYSGEQALGHLAQTAGIAVAAFLSAAVGLTASLALIRGLTRHGTDQVGNFWVDLVRAVTRVLLPLSAVAAVLLVGAGVVQNLHGGRTVTGLAGHPQTLLGGPVASYEPIKLLSGDGGGFWNASSAHPYESPSAPTNVLGIVLMMLIPSALPRMYGRMVGDRRQGWTLLAVAAALWALSVGGASAAQVAHHGTVPQAVGAATEGTEVRDGVAGSAAFGATSTATADGAADSSYDSYTALGGGVLLANMLLGEISPGGVGSGLYGLVTLALLAVFLAGLMTGRTPSFLGKQVGSREIRLVALATLATPVALLAGTALAAGLSTPAHSAAAGPHGLSEMLYAFTSAANTNGSAFAGLSSNTAFWNVGLAVAMLAGRYLPIIFTIALAGAFAGRRLRSPAGALPTRGPLFAGMVTVTAVGVGALAFLPAFALGPLAEGLL